MTAFKFYPKLCWAEKCQEYDLNLVAPGTCDVISRRDEVRAVRGSEGSLVAGPSSLYCEGSC